MAVLKNINLSNIRRFGKDIDISLSPQANIILAPNGTGKTALFEAIELALTGTVARLVPNNEASNNKNILALIRDEEYEAKVSLIFDDLEYSAIVDNNGRVERNAPKWFYGDSNIKDTGYLLRLTHLLDQRDRYWFVQEASDEAGTLLSKLPMGKDASYVSTILVGLKKSIIKSLDSKIISLENISTKINIWSELLVQREKIKKGLGEKFVTLDEIAKVLSAYRDFEFLLDSIDTLTMAQSVCASDNALELDNSKNKLIVLNNIKSNLNSYKLNLNKKNEIEFVIKNEEKLIEGIENGINEILSMIAHNIQCHAQENIELLNKKDVLDKLKLKDSILSSLKKNIDLVESKNLDLVITQKKYEEEKIKFENAKELRNRHEIFSFKKIENDKKVQAYEQAKNKKIEWCRYLDEKSVVIETIDKLNKINIEQENNLNSAKEKLDSSELKTTEAINRLSLFKQTNDKVKAAVAEIAANISEMQNDCPLCGVHHGLDELKNRIAVKLQVIDPALTAMTEFEQECQRDLLENKKNYINALSDFKISIESLKNEESKLRIIEKNIAEISKDPLFKSENIEEVDLSLNKYFENINKEKNTLEVDLKALESVTSEEEFLELKHSFKQAEENLLEINEVVSHLRDSGGSLKKELDILIENLEFNNINVDLKLVEGEYSNKKNIVEELAINRIKLESNLDGYRNNLKSIQINLSNFRLNFNDIKDEIESFEKKWTNLGFNKSLNEFEINNSISEQLHSVERAKDNLLKLEEIREQIAYLQASENFRLNQNKIDNLCHNLSEQAYEAKLRNEYSECKNEIEYYQEKKSMVDTFTKYLKEEIDEIQSKVIGIEPLWQSLLKRIIREARFSQTGLELNRRYNKSHAHVQVKVSGRDVLASLVASEAQKTDLQLTFLLSMALVHQWSPWRGLLLDDPTQHHDLVHASAVFDVLRDYMSEYGFQIIMTTHDPVQARYFARKLKNDGIETKLITLTPTVNGVEAIVNN